MTAPIPEKLKQILLEIDGKGYKAYKKLQGSSWSYAPFSLKFEHVQGDSFAFPSRLSIIESMEDSGFPENFSIRRQEGWRLKIIFYARSMIACAVPNLKSAVPGKAGSSPPWSPDKKFSNVTR